MQGSVPSWFGPRRLEPVLREVVVGLRPPMTGPDTTRTQPGQNGWRYDSPENRILVEAVSYQTAATHHLAWQDLTLRLIEPNVFLDPCFVLPAVQHFPLARRPAFLLVWDENNGERDRLIGLCPVVLPRYRGFGRFASGWMHNQSALGTPLIDRARAIETLDLMLDWLQRENRHITGLMFRRLRQDGPVMALLRNRAVLTGRDLRLFEQHERAMLSSGPDGAHAMQHSFSAKKTRELRRQRRRLESQGRLQLISATTPQEVRLAGEHFLALESRGWKGRRGTALLANASLTIFTRTMTRLLAREGKCRIDTLLLDGKPVAAGIVLQAGGYAYLWKIAYDESHAADSPGVQFILDVTRLLVADQHIIFTDSCAIPNHPMIGHVWRERLRLADALIASGIGARRMFALGAALETARRWLRARAKSAFYALTGRKAS